MLNFMHQVYFPLHLEVAVSSFILARLIYGYDASRIIIQETVSQSRSSGCIILVRCQVQQTPENRSFINT